MRFEEAIESFSIHLGSERNVSPHTRRAYLADVRQFAATLDERCDPATGSKSHKQDTGR